MCLWDDFGHTLLKTDRPKIGLGHLNILVSFIAEPLLLPYFIHFEPILTTRKERKKEK